MNIPIGIFLINFKKKMKTTGNVILITGGSSGIGLETAKLFSQKGNQVIITGRNAERLEKAAAQLKNVTAIPGISAGQKMLKGW